MNSLHKLHDAQWSAEFAWIETCRLFVDESYQRSRVRSHVAKITKDFDSRVFGAISIGRRKNGELFVIDGQQRLAAAIRRGIVAVPCVVFEVEDDKEEAQIFSKINKGRKSLTPFDKFRADVHAGDKIAIGVREVVIATKYEISNSSSDWCVKCIDALMREYRTDKDVLIGVWDFLAQLHDGAPIEGLLLRSLCLLERLSRKHGMSVLKEPNITALRKMGVSGMHAAMSNACGMYQDNNTCTRAIGLVTILNKRKRINLLPIPRRNSSEQDVAESE